MSCIGVNNGCCIDFVTDLYGLCVGLYCFLDLDVMGRSCMDNMWVVWCVWQLYGDWAGDGVGMNGMRVIAWVCMGGKRDVFGRCAVCGVVWRM